MYDIFAKKSADFHLEWLREVKETGQVRSKRHQVAIGDQEFWFSTSIVGIKDEQGQIFAYEIISRNITGRKSIEDRMINMEKLASIGTLAAGVAHEINNPMTVILGFTEHLLEQTEELPEIHETLQVIEEEGLRCKKIVENLLTFARTPERTETTADINQLLEKTLAVVKNTLLTKKIRLESHFAPDLPPAKGDPQELQQVFINLINNARDAMKGGGVLKVDHAAGPGRQTGGHRIHRYRQRHPPGSPAQDFRSLFHHQEDRRRHRPGPVHELWHHHQIRRQYYLYQLPGGGISRETRHHLYGLSPHRSRAPEAEAAGPGARQLEDNCRQQSM